MPRLHPSTIDPAKVEAPGYDRSNLRAGHLHIGVGQFHRAHQAVYADDLLRLGSKDWAIIGASLKTSTARDQLTDQDGLYILQTLDGARTQRRVIGSIQSIIDASNDTGRAELIDCFADERVQVVTLTVTEKGYDDSLAAILCAGLDARRTAGGAPITLISCDNLASNGTVLARLVHDAADPPLRTWLDEAVTFPCTMVDRIAPSVTAAHHEALERDTGYEDRGLTLAEPFRQWVIEDRFAGQRPEWKSVGVELVVDVSQHEAMKLAMLNGTHSAAAYVGRLLGKTYVHEVIEDHDARAYLERLLDVEIIPVTDAPSGIDLAEYRNEVLSRFANVAVPYTCAQVATDGSQKLPQRWLPVITKRLSSAQTIDGFSLAIATWIEHLENPAPDPLAEHLQALWQRHRPPEDLVDAIFDTTSIFDAAQPFRDELKKHVTDALGALRQSGVAQCLRTT